MKKENIIKIIALVLNLFVCISGNVILWRMLILGEGQPAEYGLHFMYLKYFTTLSNVYGSVIAGIVAAYTIINFKNNDFRIPRWLSLMYLSATSSMALTATTVLFFLGPTQGFELMYDRDMLFYHLLNPIFIVVAYLLVKHPKYYFRCTVWGIVPMALYGLFYSIFVLTGVSDDFYGFTFGGHWWAIFIALPIMLCVTYLISLLLSIKNLRQQK